MTTITVLGAGNIGSAVAGIAAKSGATVQVIDRDAAKAQTAAGNGTGSVWGAAIEGDIVVLALPYPAYADAIAAYGPQLAGKVVVDPSNPIDFSTFDSVVPAEYGSAAAELAAKLKDAKIVKAFNTNFAATLASGEIDGTPTTVAVASDDEDAKKAVAGFVQAAGLRTVDAGPLKRAANLEGMGALQIFLGITEQTPWPAGFKIVK